MLFLFFVKDLRACFLEAGRDFDGDDTFSWDPERRDNGTT